MGESRSITYREALNEALREEMLRDRKVILIGEDIGVYGGGFGVTKGLIEEFGDRRVLETPVSETAFVGAATGSAIMGMRPVVELMFADFMGVCWDQIMNEAAKIHFMYGGRMNVPMVIRTASGAGTGAAAQHSQSLENMYCQVPGLKVVVPSTPRDAKGLLKSAIRDDNPVIFLEQKTLYKESGEIPAEEYVIELGKADIKREGKDISIISWGRMVPECLKVADKLAKEGISCEVLDLRTLSPLDKEAIINTAEKTGRVLVVHESVEFGGFGAEVACTINESSAWSRLKAPVKRLGGAFCPIGSAREFEEKTLPTALSIENAVRETL